MYLMFLSSVYWRENLNSCKLTGIVIDYSCFVGAILKLHISLKCASKCCKPSIATSLSTN